MKVKIKKKIKKLCDPGYCDECVYVGEGDFICTKLDEPVLVMDEWVPTDKFCWCSKIRNK